MKAFIVSFLILASVLYLIPRARGKDIARIFEKMKPAKDDAPKIELVSATRAYEINEKDPRIVSRAYFTEKKSGSVGTFVGANI
tara:strand:+ start:78 stop:329 length:252 start_codon:yes stop_codon:yes gene_type:complete